MANTGAVLELGLKAVEDKAVSRQLSAISYQTLLTAVLVQNNNP